MKKLTILIAGLMFTALAHTQIYVDNDMEGLYFTADYSMYSGIHKEMYDNGNLRLEASLNNGVLDGETRLYFENGRLQEVRNYKSGRMNGLWETFNTEGVKTAQAFYKHGKKDGEPKQVSTGDPGRAFEGTR